MIRRLGRRAFGLMFFAKNERSARLCREVALWMLAQQVDFYVESQSRLDLDAVEYLPKSRLASHCQFVLVIGGDGSILRAARYCARFGAVLVGLHGGTVGFLTQLDENNWQDGLQMLLSGRYEVQERLMLQARVERGGKTLRKFLALNDAVLKVSSLSRIMNFRLYCNQVFVDEYPGDGILISTPTGSTGYSLSTGGPLIQPDHDLMLMSPICTHRFKARPFVFRARDRLTLEVLQHSPGVRADVALTVDGQEGCLIGPEDLVQIETSQYRVRMAVVFEQDFFATLRRKID